MTWAKNLFGAQQNKEEEKPKFHMTDEMLLSELPNDLATEFNDIYETIQEYKKELSVNSNNVSASTVEVDVKNIEEITKEYQEGPLTSLTRHIDSGYNSFFESKKELEIAKTDFQNASHIRGTPSPFMKRYTNRLIKEFEQSSQALESFNIRFQPESERSLNGQNSNHQINPSQAITSLLTEEYQSILRCSSRLAKIKKRHDDLITQFSNRGITFDIDQNQETEKHVCYDILQQKKKIFYDNRKLKTQKVIQDTDLFGNYEVAEQKKTSGFGSFTFAPKTQSTSTKPKK